jgi:putative membrane protein
VWPVPVISLVLASLAALLHVYFFVLESVAFRKPFAYRAFGTPKEDVETLSFAMYNQGFYNLFLAVGTFVGVVGVLRDWEPQGTTLVVFCTACMVAAALVLVAKKPSMARAAAIQGLLPLLALVSAWLL